MGRHKARKKENIIDHLQHTLQSSSNDVSTSSSTSSPPPPPPPPSSSAPFPAIPFPNAATPAAAASTPPPHPATELTSGFYNSLEHVSLAQQKDAEGHYGAGGKKNFRGEKVLVEGEGGAAFSSGNNEEVHGISSDPLQQSRITDNLRRALSTNDRTNRVGYETVVVLGRQTEVLQNTLGNVGEARENLEDARRTMRAIRWGVYKEYLWKGLVIAVLFFWLCLVIYLRFIRRK